MKHIYSGSELKIVIKCVNSVKYVGISGWCHWSSHKTIRYTKLFNESACFKLNSTHVFKINYKKSMNTCQLLKVQGKREVTTDNNIVQPFTISAMSSFLQYLIVINLTLYV